ncbi:MAG: hypothetical protein ACE5HH_03050 [Candidatus Hydrothermarchaeales archaeon]
MAVWKCPKCGFVKDVVCPVCGTDKKAGTTCTACGSEYSHTSCPKCGYSEWHEQPLKSDSYQEKIKEILRTRKNKYLTYYELMRLTAIYELSSLQRVCENDPIDVKNVSCDAFRLSANNFARELCKLRGVSEALAHKIWKAMEADESEDSH